VILQSLVTAAPAVLCACTLLLADSQQAEKVQQARKPARRIVAEIAIECPRLLYHRPA
jgi:hypothetical protein